MDSHSPLVVKNLIKKYGSFIAVNGVSFALEEGEIFGLLGPNGAGKTTSISMIAGLDTPTSGDITIFGRNTKRDANWVKQWMGVVPQELITHGFFTVEEILTYHCGYYGLTRTKWWVNELLERLHLAPYRDRPAILLSGGLKRRLLLAKALVHQPRLLLLDEPTAGVDVEFRDTLWEIIREWNQKGMTILLTTHYLEEAEKMCRRIGIIYSGNLLRLDFTEKLVQQFSDKKLIIFLKNPVKVQNDYIISQREKKIIFRFPRTRRLFDFIQEIGIKQEDIEDLSLEEGTLEDAFRHIITNK